MISEFMKGRCVALSISESADMGVLGLSDQHLEDAMAEIAAHLLSCGANLIYGGDLRPGGFTEVLFELVNRYRLNSDEKETTVRNFLAWPIHSSMDRTELEEHQKALEGVAELVLLDPNGIPIDARLIRINPLGPPDWKNGLTAMRERMAVECDARIVLGGRTAGFRGALPGVIEEAFIQMRNGAPLYVLGGFGGSSAELARELGFARDGVSFGRLSTSYYYAALLRKGVANGLTFEENVVLANTIHADEAVALIIRGLLRVFDGAVKGEDVIRSSRYEDLDAPEMSSHNGRGEPEPEMEI